MTMTDVQGKTTNVVYDLQGTLLEACSCGILCPCWVGEDPDGGSCDAFNAYHFDAGTIRGVDVSGLSLVKVVRIPGNVLAPNSWRQVIFVDDRASKEQAEALIEAYQGDLGGPLADLAGLVGETLAIERATIVHEVSDGEGTLRVGDVVSSRLGPYRGPDGSVTTLRDSLFSTVPGSPAWVGKASTHTVNLPQYGMVWSFENRNAIQADYRMSHSEERGLMSTTRATAHRLPVAVPVAIAAAWAVAVIAQASGKAELLHHDALIEGHLPLWVALCLFLLAWQVMIAAMMLPSTLPMVRLFAAASTSQERPGETQAAFLAGYLVVWTVFGALAFVGDMGLHHLVDATPWLAARPWLIAGSALVARRRLPVLRGQGPVPLGMPASRRLPPRALPARRGGGVPARAGTRAVLPGLLLGADAADVRGGCRQPVVDGGADRGDGVREGWTRGGPDDAAGRECCCSRSPCSCSCIRPGSRRP